MFVRVVNAQLLQEDLELEQVRVNSLTHMVVVVDESSGDSATAALESKLQVRPQQQGCTFIVFISCIVFSALMFSTGGGGVGGQQPAGETD